MVAIPRYRPHAGPAVLSAGFRPFFLAAAIWAAAAVPLWLSMFAGDLTILGAGPAAVPPLVWHAHEMVFGFALAAVAGFLLTAIPNWTGRLPLQGWPLATLVLLWAAGRVAFLLSAGLGPALTAVVELSFPTVFLLAIAREIVAGRNWRNLPVLGALAALLASDLLVQIGLVGLADTTELGDRAGVATLVMLISLIGGRIIPSFTRNWLAKIRPTVPAPAAPDRFDAAVLVLTGLALAAWVAAPQEAVTRWPALLAGAAAALRLWRWRGIYVLREPLLLVLHIGYGWIVVGLLLLGSADFLEILPQTAALHALTAGAVGTMTLAVMTRASLGHTGRPLTAGPGTVAIYLLVSAAALLRVLSPLAGDWVVTALWAAGLAWAGAFGLFAVLYGQILLRPRGAGAWGL